jgi:hypothetical protein
MGIIMQRCEQCGQINKNYEERCVYCGSYLSISVDHEDEQFNHYDDSRNLTDEILNELTQNNTEPLDYNDETSSLFDQVVEDNLYHEEEDEFIYPEEEEDDEYLLDERIPQKEKTTKKRHIIELEYELKKKIKRNKKLEQSFGIELKDIDIDMTSITQPIDILGSYRLSPNRGFRQVSLSVICYDILKNKIARNNIILHASATGQFRNFKITINPNIHKTAMIILLPEEIIETDDNEEIIPDKKQSDNGTLPKNNIFIEQMRDIERKIGMKISNTAVIIKARDRFEIVGEIYLKSPDKYETIKITATCYDKDNNILATESTRLNTKLFLGFDTLRLKVDEVDVSKVEHVKLYPTLQE